MTTLSSSRIACHRSPSCPSLDQQILRAQSDSGGRNINTDLHDHEPERRDSTDGRSLQRPLACWIGSRLPHEREYNRLWQPNLRSGCNGYILELQRWDDCGERDLHGVSAPDGDDEWD